jgi:hypothetical protein
MNFCPGCGTQLSAVSGLFCHNCGRELTKNVSPDNDSEVQQEAGSAKVTVSEIKLPISGVKPQQKTRGGKRNIIVISIVVIFLIGAAGLIRVKNDNEDAAICKTEVNEAYARFFVAWFTPTSISNQPLLSFSGELSDMASRAHDSSLKSALEADSNNIDKKSSKPDQTWAYCGRYFDSDSE